MIDARSERNRYHPMDAGRRKRKIWRSQWLVARLQGSPCFPIDHARRCWPSTWATPGRPPCAPRKRQRAARCGRPGWCCWRRRRRGAAPRRRRRRRGTRRRAAAWWRRGCPARSAPRPPGRGSGSARAAGSGPSTTAARTGTGSPHAPSAGTPATPAAGARRRASSSRRRPAGAARPWCLSPPYRNPMRRTPIELQFLARWLRSGHPTGTGSRRRPIGVPEARESAPESPAEMPFAGGSGPGEWGEEKRWEGEDERRRGKSGRPGFPAMKEALKLATLITRVRWCLLARIFWNNVENGNGHSQER